MPSSRHVRQAGGACVFWHIFEISWFCPCPGLSALDSYIVDHRKEHQDQLAEATSALALVAEPLRGLATWWALTSV